VPGALALRIAFLASRRRRRASPEINLRRSSVGSAPDLRRVLRRLWVIICRHGVSFGIEPLARGERLVGLPDDCLAVTTSALPRLVMAISSGAMSSWDDLDVLRIARRLAENEGSS